jgi:fibro-slime domain-containing protein
MNRTREIVAVLALLAQPACGDGASFSQFTKTNSMSSAGSLGSSAGKTGSLGSGVAGTNGAGAAPTADGGAGSIQAIVRDFRFYDATDSTTVPDFENPPYNEDGNGNPQPAGQIYYGPWDDREVVTSTLGADGKPVYKNPSGTTLTTHGQAFFDKWYNDVPGTNYKVSVPISLTLDPSTGTYTYDSNVSGVPYNVSGQSGNGFFPIDDGTPYATPFGDQVPTNAEPPYMGSPHNYSFTVEIDTVFTYAGGETFSFRGDDDVYVYINNQLVINLGGVHGPETANVDVETLGLTVGQTYALNFFSAERHVTGSNIMFSTTLRLTSGTIPK